MDKINQNRISSINYGSVKPAKGEVKTMEQSLKEMIKNVLARAEREVPEYGDFAPVYENIKNHNKNLCPSEFQLKIESIPKGIENAEITRVLKLVAGKDGSSYSSSRSIAYGTKSEILDLLKSQEILSKIKNAAVKLSEDLSDM